MTLKGASLLSRLVNRSAHLWFAVHVAEFAVSWCARGERRIDEAIRRLAVGRKNAYIVLVKANQQDSAEPQMKSTT